MEANVESIRRHVEALNTLETCIRVNEHGIVCGSSREHLSIQCFHQQVSFVFARVFASYSIHSSTSASGHSTR